MSKLDSMASKYIPTKEHIKNVLIFYHRLKKESTEAHDKIIEAYGEENSVTQSYCDYWFKRFDTGDFNLDDDDVSAVEIQEEL